MESYAICILRARPLTICERVYCIRRTGGRTRDGSLGDDGYEAKWVWYVWRSASREASEAGLSGKKGKEAKGEGSERGRGRRWFRLNGR